MKIHPDVRCCRYCKSEESDSNPLRDGWSFRPSVFSRAISLGIEMPICIRCFNAKQAGTNADAEYRPASVLLEALKNVRSGMIERAEASPEAARKELSGIEDLAEQYDSVWKGIQLQIDSRESLHPKSKRVARDWICSDIQRLNKCREKLAKSFAELGKLISLNYSDDRKNANLFNKRRWVRDIVMERDGHRCRACGRLDSLTLDHVIPVALGGENSITNLQILCRPCNSRKGEGKLEVSA